MQLSRTVVSAIVLTALALLSHTVFAARLEEVHVRFLIDDTKKKHGPTDRALPAAAKARRHAEVLELDADSTFTLLDSSKENNVEHYRYQQLFRGIPVYQATVKISEDHDGNLRSLFGSIARDLVRDLSSTAANLSPAQALVIAKQAALIGQNANMPTENETSEKVIYIGDDSVARVAYKAAFSIASPTEPSAPTFMIDANSGEILARWDSMAHANATGPGGNPKTGQYEYGTTPGRGYLNVMQVGGICTMDNT